jgi:uncharacterized phage-associated protein
MQYPAVAVANALLEMARAEGRALDPMQLQKLVYFAHGWHLGLTGDPLIREDIQAWNYGPVIPTLYQELKQYGSGNITDLIGDLRFERPTVTDLNTRRFLEKIWSVYGKLSGLQLSDMTHRPDTPWTKARSGVKEFIRGVVIPESAMREYFSTLAGKNAGTLEPVEVR